MCFIIEDFGLNISADIAKFLLYVGHFNPQHVCGKFLVEQKKVETWFISITKKDSHGDMNMYVYM